MNNQDDYHNIGLEIGITIRRWRPDWTSAG